MPSTSHLTQSNPQTSRQFSSSAYPQNPCKKSSAMQHGTLGLRHITIPVCPECHKNTSCVSLSCQSISIGLTSQRISQLERTLSFLWYPTVHTPSKTQHTSDTSSKEKIFEASELDFLAPKLISPAIVGLLPMIRRVCLVEPPPALEQWKMLTNKANYR